MNKHGFKALSFQIDCNHECQVIDADTSESVFTSWLHARTFVDDIWYRYKLDYWLELCSPEFVPCLNDYGVKEFEMHIDLYHKPGLIRVLKGRSGLESEVYQWILTFDNKVSDYVARKMREYPHIHYSLESFQFILTRQ